ncbi:glycogen synthase GlgA [Lacticaseibacillus brantae]|uniref:Glycogen synthase n=1 Tax=Lacticaseibacillus brantae DSM 23927 TaxID=1423727 RepID=A0A0R2AXR4_9LACO|nr:glycogen synthase GlgA [Lacticaseibacillus brantae]KRM72184.1 starch synthase [Lacticaseibacillus brantae DSM 23927]
MKVLFAAAEGAPFYKVGGLGDVAYALPKALQQLGVDIRVVLPYYSHLFPDHLIADVSDLGHFSVDFGGRAVYVGIKTMKLGAVPVYFIDNEEFFGRDQLYGEWDDGGRFGFFQLALIEMLQVIDWIPDIIHANDWHTAMIPVLLEEKYAWIAPYAKIKTQLTIHNLQFQGVFPESVLDTVFGIGRRYFNETGFAKDGAVNYLKGGIDFADVVSTVSPSYAREIQQPYWGEGLDAALRSRGVQLQGILNGIDTALYNPATDQALAGSYSATDLQGKVIDKHDLQRLFQLPEGNRPVFGMVTRLTRQKGVDLVIAALQSQLHQLDAQVIILGTGDPDLENQLLALQPQFPDQLRIRLAFDENVARKIYAGADFFLMPSAFEPSGLSQMMAMRYGTIPIVHETGGLRDSVKAYDETTGIGTGYIFWDFRPEVLGQLMNQATVDYTQNQAKYLSMQSQAMAEDFSWTHAAQQYLAGYTALI